jgi:lipopolysaccharide export system permease protein
VAPVKRLFTYIGGQLGAGIVLVWAALLVIDSTFVLFSRLAEAGGDGALFLARLALELPARAWALFPMACLIGALWRLGDLAARRELVAARIAGVSAGRIAAWALVAGLLLTVPAFWLGEGVAPDAGYRARLLRAEAEMPNLGVDSNRELWLRDGARIVRIQSVDSLQLLTGLQVIEFGADRQLSSISEARAARFERGRWRLEDFRRTAFLDGRTRSERATETTWEDGLDPALVRVLMRTPQQMTLPELVRYLVYLESNGLAAEPYALSFWSRLAQPVTAWTMLLLGLAIVLSRVHPSRTGPRLLLGVLVGLGFRLVSETTAHAGLVYGIPGALAVWLPPLAAGLVAVLLLRRAS